MSFSVKNTERDIFLWFYKDFRLKLMPCAAFPHDQPTGKFDTNIFITGFISPIHKKGYGEMRHFFFGDVYGCEERRRLL